MQGNLGPGVMPTLLRQVYAEGKTGTLRFARGEEQSSFRFVRGHIFRAASSAKRAHMGEIMVARGMLSAEALERATEVVRRERRLLGDVLKEMGVIDQHVLEDALVLHVIEVLAEVFSWSDGSYAFEERDPETFLEEADYPLKLSTGSMILEAVALVEDRGAVRFALGDMDRVLLPCSDARLRFQRVDLAPIDGFVLSRIDGALSAREVIAVTPMQEDAVEKSLFALLCTGLVEPAPELQKKPVCAAARSVRQEILDAYQDSSTRSHYELLGVGRTATDAEIKAAYCRLAKRLHPDIHHDPALADLRDQIEALFTRLNVAYGALSHPHSRAAYDAKLDARAPAPETIAMPRGTSASPPTAAAPGATMAASAAASSEAPRAEDLFSRAKECVDGGRHWEAVGLLGETIRFADDHLRPRARVLLAQAYLRSPDGVRNAEKELLTALQEDPGSIDACMALGEIYKKAGLPARAKGMFQRVLELKPGHRKAVAELEERE